MANASLTSSGVTDGRIGRSASAYMTSTVSGQSGGVYLNDWTAFYNQDSENSLK